MQPYERFEAWKLAHAFALAIYALTKAWPPEERFGLTSQIRRSAFSVAANIAEGSARRGSKEFGRFLEIAFASIVETGYTLRFAHDLKLVPAEAFTRLEGQRQAASRVLFLLLKSMRAA
jgi:four helix bundle protein